MSIKVQIFFFYKLINIFSNEKKESLMIISKVNISNYNTLKLIIRRLIIEIIIFF